MQVIGIIVAAICGAILWSGLMAFPLMWLWNVVVPVVFGLPMLDWANAFWLYLLTQLFMPSSSNGGKK